MTAAVSGLRARMESLEMLANNMANSTTGGYKSDREIYTLYASPEADGALGHTATAPEIDSHWTDHSEATLRATGNQFDLAISGRGFFAVDGPSGPLYTRNGSFKVSAAGVLTTGDGHAIRTLDGRPLRLQANIPAEVSVDGEVRQESQLAGRLQIVDFENRSQLVKQGSSYFRSADSRPPLPAAGAQVHQGKLEGSNFGAAEGAVRLVSVMRQFEMLQRAIALGGEMNRHAIEEVAKVNP